MVLHMARYPMTFPDASELARTPPYHRSLPQGPSGQDNISPTGGQLICGFFVINSKEDPLSTPFKYRQLPESEVALKCRALLFRYEGDKELAEKTKWTTLADPYHGWSRTNSRRKARAETEAKAAPQS